MLTVPSHLRAAEIRNSYQDYEKTIINKPNCDPIKGSNAEGCFYTEAKRARQTKSNSEYNCSCVEYVRFRSGINVGPIGVARNHPVNSVVPVSGGLVVFRWKNLGHMGYVTWTDGVNFLYDEGNADGHCAIHLGTTGHVGQTNIIGFYR
ncbi:MAG TPA: hypothetical protein VF974_04925 [Patescibacteria group bacterium]